MTLSQINDKAFELRTKLFNLLNEFKELQLAAIAAGQHDAADEIDTAARQLAGVYQSLPDVFTDATRR